ncbi:MAG TPA: T9SS type A sorting domain-containing protein, partial [Salinivirgaceae bacterium]|nr:T9SS type A sorting domain-containing protein [Salinivirgaceae bacterium]
IYDDESSTQTLQPSEIGIFTNTVSFRPKLQGEYKISTTITDGNTEDSTLNQIELEFNITDGLFSYIDTSSTSSYLALQADTSSTGYGYGQAFWIPDILTNKVVFNNLAFFVHSSQNPNHLTAQDIDVQGYLFKKQGVNYEIVQTTNVYKPVATDIGKFVNLQFNAPQELDGNQSYYLVLKVMNQSLTKRLMLAHDPNHHQSYGNSGIKIGSSNNLIVVDKTPVFYTNITGGYIPEETDILAYNIDGQLDNTIINSENKTVELTMPYGTDMTSLIPKFVLSVNAVAKIGEEEQISGTSVVDFTDTTVIYTIVNGDTLSSEWSVTVNLGPEPPAEFISFNIDGQIGQTTINTTNRTVSLVMPENTDMTALIPIFEITAGATAFINDSVQISGSTANDFTNPVIYKLVTQGGVDYDWTVTVTEQGSLLSGCDILSFGFIGQTQQADINTEAKTVYVNLPPSTSVHNLVPIFNLSPGAKAYHLQFDTETPVVSGGNIIDFTFEVIFRVKAENMIDFSDWKINVTTNQNSQADFESFEVHLVVQNIVDDTVTVQDTIPYYATIYKTNNTMLLQLPEGTRLDSIQPIWTVSPGAIVKINDTTIVQSGESYMDLSKLVVFKVVSQHAQGAKQIKTWTLHTSYIVGIEEQDHDIYTNVKMYPNPASHYINVDLPEDMRNGSYQIFNIYGQTVAAGTYRGIQFNIDIQGQPKGIYFIKVSSDRYHKIDKFLFE